MTSVRHNILVAVWIILMLESSAVPSVSAADRHNSTHTDDEEAHSSVSMPMPASSAGGLSINEVNVDDFGAKGNGTTHDKYSFIKAWNNVVVHWIQWLETGHWIWVWNHTGRIAKCCLCSDENQEKEFSSNLLMRDGLKTQTDYACCCCCSRNK
ncbi:hypothetical protein M9H77_36256 [Catharanthus roseus]|uniref:Uncharacterized protein n=1 Tax=Catharanthus roseus TaxID=4058 RepID=A0ACB9ZSK7_CATRO|nr:hypothetical protein M9H77_36256 [Catharanthus roseus]